MSKEQLEVIKEKYKHLQGDLMRDDLDWLIRQAERVQEWKDIAQWQNDEKLKMEKVCLEVEQQNKHYREALKSISNGPGEVGCLELFAHKTLEGDPYESIDK